MTASIITTDKLSPLLSGALGRVQVEAVAHERQREGGNLLTSNRHISRGVLPKYTMPLN